MADVTTTNYPMRQGAIMATAQVPKHIQSVTSIKPWLMMPFSISNRVSQSQDSF
jgi:hypothetical protein